jgi:hypothetical protein
MEVGNNSGMLDTDDNPPAAKSGERKRKAAQPSKKAAQRNRKSAQQQETLPNAAQAAPEQVSEPISAPIGEQPSEEAREAVNESAGEPTREQASEETREPINEPVGAPFASVGVEPVSVPVASVDSAAKNPSPIEAPSTVAAEPAEAAPVSPMSIANAYGDYSRKSLEQTRCFLEKLAGVRSPAKAFELQTEFAREAFDTFITESRKIRDLHAELVRQRFKHFEGFVAGITQIRR